jgi:hypothetical protein
MLFISYKSPTIFVQHVVLGLVVTVLTITNIIYTCVGMKCYIHNSVLKIRYLLDNTHLIGIFFFHNSKMITLFFCTDGNTILLDGKGKPNIINLYTRKCRCVVASGLIRSY